MNVTENTPETPQGEPLQVAPGAPLHAGERADALGAVSAEATAAPREARAATADSASPADEPQNESDLAAWAAKARPSFPDRTAFNLALCDGLAKIGIPPTQAAVLRVGRWGQTSSVARDVALWYQGIGERLDKRDDMLPVAVRKQAYELLETLWKLATSDVDQRLVMPLRATAEQAAAERKALIETHAGVVESSKQAHAALEIAQRDRDGFKGQLDAVTASRQDMAVQLALRSREVEQARNQSMVDAAQHREALAAALLQRETALRDQAHGFQAQLAALRASLEAQARQDRERLIRQVDEARQEAVRAQARHRALEAQVAQAHENTAHERIAAAQAQAALAEVVAQRASLRQENVRLHERIEASSSLVAVLQQTVAHQAQAGEPGQGASVAAPTVPLKPA
jgi:hypothetical protein